MQKIPSSKGKVEFLEAATKKMQNEYGDISKELAQFLIAALDEGLPEVSIINLSEEGVKETLIVLITNRAIQLRKIKKGIKSSNEKTNTEALRNLHKLYLSIYEALKDSDVFQSLYQAKSCI
jgi:hypothetical protein